LKTKEKKSDLKSSEKPIKLYFIWRSFVFKFAF